MQDRRHKIILYNPVAVFHTMPLALLAIGSALDRSRYDVRIIDGRLEPDPVAAVLQQLGGALCLGVTMLTGEPINDAIGVFRAAKAAHPEIATVAGGWHPSLFPAETLCEPSIDITVAGQGERTFAELVERLAESRSLEGVAGVTFRSGDSIVRNKPRHVESMDNFAAPDFDLIDVERYFTLKKKRQLDYITSIGCNYRCAFCADPFVYGRDWKGVSPARLGEEIEALWRRHHFTDLNFQDETFFTHRRRIAEICEEFLRRKLKFTWAATLRADQGVRLPDETWQLCLRSGLRRVLVGVETGSADMMKRIQKDTTIDAVLETAEKCRRHNIAVIFSFIVGFPGEAPEEVDMTLNLMTRLRAMSAKFETPLFYYKPYPGSSLAASVADSMPKSLEDWARFDWYEGDNSTSGLPPQLYRRIERFKFYNKYAWGPRTPSRRLLQGISRWRVRNDWYGLPLEKLLVQTLMPEQRLS